MSHCEFDPPSREITGDRRNFYEVFEEDVQRVFDEISAMKKTAQKNVIIMKGGNSVKGDYFISLKSIDVFQLSCEELIQKLTALPYVSDIKTDSHHNLVFMLRRQDVFQSSLKEVFAGGDAYGMSMRENVVLVLIHEEISKDFDNMRTALLAQHITCILTSNNNKVYYNEPKTYCKGFPGINNLVCSDNCDLNAISKSIAAQLDQSQWKADSDLNDNLCIDAKSFLENSALVEKYGRAINSISISNPDSCSVLCRTAYVKHLIEDHMPTLPDLIVHVAVQGQTRTTCESGILVEMLGYSKMSQIYVFNQTVQYKNKISSSIDDFKDAHQTEIHNALGHKYGVDISKDDVWASRVESLVDTAVKFDFLKVNHNMVLNLREPSCRDGGKNFGIFVQYNYARLSNLFRTFEEKVSEGFYDPLLPLEETDFSLLKLEEEWNLFHYVLHFPKLTQNVVESLLSNGSVNAKYRLNKVCLMLWDLCVQLSLYYSRTRILVANVGQQQKTMSSRLWLLKGIFQVFSNSFALLGVEGLDQM